jgi:hypothetical protein
LICAHESQIGVAEWVAAQTSIWTGGYNLQNPHQFWAARPSRWLRPLPPALQECPPRTEIRLGRDYPNGDYNFLQRLAELTTIKMSHWDNGYPGFSRFTAMDPNLCSLSRRAHAERGE